MSRGKEAPKQPGGFASRWSRLKREAEAPAPKEAAAEPEAPAEDTRTDAEVLEALGLPDPDTLESGDDFAAFLTRAVPVRLRNRALRRLWLSDPVLANLDALVDYGEDFSDAATVVENLQTAYRVGRGFADRVAEIADNASEEEPPEAGPPEEEPAAAPAEPGEEPADAAAAVAEAEAPAPPMAENPVEPHAGDRKPRPRPRMRFRLPEE